MDSEKSRQDIRSRLYEIIFESDTPAGKAFDVILILCILLSVGVVMLDSVASLHARFRPLFYGLEWFFTILFTIEYILRLYCVPSKLRYAVSFFGIVDLLSILPTYLSVLVFHSRYLMVIRILRVLRIFRVLKLGHHVHQADLIRQALYASRQKILVFLIAVLTLVVVIGALIYLIEGPENGFTSIPKSIYWAVVTLTTVGYGDLSPATPLGQFLAILVMLMGYSIIAVPTGIVTAHITAAPEKASSIKKCSDCGLTSKEADALYCRRCGRRLGTHGSG